MKNDGASYGEKLQSHGVRNLAKSCYDWSGRLFALLIEKYIVKPIGTC